MAARTRDLRLRYADDYSLAGNAPPTDIRDGKGRLANYVGGFAGQMPVQCTWYGPTGQVDRSGNQATYACLILAADFKLAVPYILGFSATGDGGNLTRLLPIKDPDGMGMRAVKIPRYQFVNPSGMQALELPATGNVAPDGNVYNDVLNELYGPWDLDLPPAAERVHKKFRYCLLEVAFEHTLYTVASDDVVASSPQGERERYMITEWIPGMEYVGLESGVLMWQTGPGSMLPPPGNQVTTGGGFVRSVGELKISWYDLPSDAYESLSAVWEGLQGKTNDRDFIIFLGDTKKTYSEGTLLFQPARTTYKISPLGFLTYDANLTLQYRPEEWNKFLYWPTGKYEFVTKKDSSFIYPEMNFDTMFQV
jgi:hypothetical protein